jgi:hypothetical protein
MASEIVNYIINSFAHYINSLVVLFFFSYVNIPFTFRSVSSLSNFPRPGMSFRNTLYFPDHTVAVGASSHSLKLCGRRSTVVRCVWLWPVLMSVGEWRTVMSWIDVIPKFGSEDVVAKFLHLFLPTSYVSDCLKRGATECCALRTLLHIESFRSLI